MKSIQDVTESVIKEFIDDGTLFTALDVSNKVKEVLPFAKHREVREIVRGSFATIMGAASYARTPIKVTLQDGSVTDALLYHPMSDSWDLDNKYDAQKRSQTTLKPTAITVPTVTTVVPVPTTNSISPTTVTPIPAVAVNVAPPPAPLTPTQLWKNLFSSQPSLFSQK